jgi:AraC-like DNA-binding protein
LASHCEGGEPSALRSATTHSRDLGDTLRVENAPMVVSRLLRKSEISVTEIRSDNPREFTTDPMQPDDGWNIALQLRDFGAHKLWEDGKAAKLCDLHAGDSVIYDMKRKFVIHLDRPFHSVHFYIPQRALDAISEDAGATKVTALDYEPGRGVPDPTLLNLGGSMMAALERPEQANTLFVDHVTFAVAVHVAQAFGRMAPIVKPALGGLAPWQERRALELLSANLNGRLTLKQIAQECGLSVSHFSRAFRQTVGLPPHSWLINRRVEIAKALLRNKQKPLADVAFESGFVDQSHLTRVFTRAVGNSPGAWRRCIQE